MKLVLKVNWTISSSPVDGYVIEYNDSTGSGNVLDVITNEVVINNLSLSLYTISVYSYKDVISLNTTQVLLFNGELYNMVRIP